MFLNWKQAMGQWHCGLETSLNLFLNATSKVAWVDRQNASCVQAPKHVMTLSLKKKRQNLLAGCEEEHMTVVEVLSESDSCCSHSLYAPFSLNYTNLCLNSWSHCEISSSARGGCNALYQTVKYQLNLTSRYWRTLPVWRRTLWT